MSDEEEVPVRRYCPNGGVHRPPTVAHYALCPCGAVTRAEWLPAPKEGEL